MVRERKMSKQAIAIVVLSILLLALLAVNITLAYFTAQGATNNQTITFDTLTLTVTDTNWSMSSSSENETMDNIVPGSTIDLAGNVVLTGTPAYLKVKFNVTATPAENKVLDNVAIGAIEVALGSVLTSNAGQTWVQGTDNAWYCISSVEASDTPVIDFAGKSAMIPLSTTSNDWQGATITVNYTIQAVQSAHVDLTGASNDEKASSLKELIDSLDFASGTPTE